MRLTIPRPDDWHLHLRDGEGMRDVLPHTARRFGRAIVMPNLKPPITSVAAAANYRERILAARPEGSDFEPLMTLYLTDNTPADEIAAAKASDFVHGVKYYPAGATTNSDNGVTDLDRVRPVLAAMERHDLPLLIHGEVTHADVDVFDREKRFVDRVLDPLVTSHPELRIVLEHITTAEGAEFVRQSGDKIGGTITAHHLLWNRNEIFRGGLRPHAFCLPVLKRESHREALLIAAATNDRIFLGTDSAPHPRTAKESACGCAGVYTAHAAIELYAEAFDSMSHIERLEEFASRRGPAFYRLPVSERTITLEREPQPVPTTLPFGDEELVPMRAGETLAWRLVESDG